MSPWSLKKRMWVFSARPVSQSLFRMRPMFQSMFSTMAQAPAYSRRARSSRCSSRRSVRQSVSYPGSRRQKAVSPCPPWTQQSYWLLLFSYPTHCWKWPRRSGGTVCRAARPSRSWKPSRCHLPKYAVW